MVATFGKNVRQPVHSFDDTLPIHGTTGLNVPRSTAGQRVETEFVAHFRCGHGHGKILLVSKDKNRSVGEFIVGQQTKQFILGQLQTWMVVGIHDKDQSIRSLIIVSPQRSNLVLATYIPNRETNVFVIDSFDIETYGRNGRDAFRNVCVWLYNTNNNLCKEMTHHGGSKEQIYCAFYQLTLVEFHLIEKSCLSSSICFEGEGGTTCQKIWNQRQRQK